MNLEYSFQTTDFGTFVMRLPDQYSLIEDFLISDVGLSNGSRYLKILNTAAHVEGFSEVITGNTTTLIIKSDKSKVINNPLDKECEIDTLLLRSIIEVYAKYVYVNTLEMKLKREQELLTRSMKDIVGSTGLKLIETFEAVDERLKKWA